MKPQDFQVKNLGNCKIETPINLSKNKGDQIFNFVEDSEKILFDVVWNNPDSDDYTPQEQLLMELAGRHQGGVS